MKHSVRSFYDRGHLLPVLVIVLFGVLARTINLSTTAWAPDSYERLEATQRLLSGDFPLSKLYSPGPVFLLAPFFSVLPQTLMTIQAVSIIFGLLAILISYWGALRLTSSKTVPLMLAFATAADPFFVSNSRVALFDMMSLGLLLSGFALTPRATRSSLGSIALALIFAVLIHIRPISVVSLPALLIFWMWSKVQAVDPKAFLRTATSKQAIIFAGVLVSCSVLFAISGGWLSAALHGTNGAGESKVYFGNFGEHVLNYWSFTVVSLPGLIFLGPLAIVGFRRLLVLNRGLALACLYILMVWPLIHAPFIFAATRYMLPTKFIFYLLVVVGLHKTWEISFIVRWAEVSRRAALASALILSGLYLVGGSIVIVCKGSEIASRSDDGMFEYFRPIVDSLPRDTLMVTGPAQVLRQNRTDLDYVDLLEEYMRSVHPGHGPKDVSATISQALSEGRDAYYLRTQWEENIAGWGDRYSSYFQSVSSNFSLEEVTRSPILNSNGYRWILYRVSARRFIGSNTEPPASSYKTR